MIAFVAIKRVKGGGACFAYLPTTEISLPQGWEYGKLDGEYATEDVGHVAKSFGITDLTEVCRIMCMRTDLEGKF